MLFIFSKYYCFGLGLDTRDSNAYVSRAKRTRYYAETATFPRANFVYFGQWSYGYLRSKKFALGNVAVSA